MADKQPTKDEQPFTFAEAVKRNPLVLTLSELRQLSEEEKQKLRGLEATVTNDPPVK